MSDVINLKQMRKRKMREEKAKKAEENRIAFGRSKSEKKLSIKEKIKQSRSLDGKKLDKNNTSD